MSVRIFRHDGMNKLLPVLCSAVLVSFAVQAQQPSNFEEELPMEAQSDEVKKRNAVLENNVFPLELLGDRLTKEQNFERAYEAYARACQVFEKAGLGDSEYVNSIRVKLKAKVTGARKAWGAAVFAEAKKIYLPSLTIKDAEAAVKGFRDAKKLAQDSIAPYYAGAKTGKVSPTTLDVLIKKDPAFNDNVQAFMMDCDKMEDAYRFREETSLSAVDPDYSRRNKEISFLLRQADIYYKNREYAKVRTAAERVLVLDPYNQKAISLLNRTYKKLEAIGIARSENDAMEQMAETEWLWNEPIPPMDADSEEAAPKEMTGNRTALYDKLQKIIVDKIEYESTDIQSILEHLVRISKQQDPTGEGVSIIPPSNLELRTRKIQYLELEQMPLLDIIRYVCEIAGLKYKIEDKAVMVGVKAAGDMEIGFYEVRKTLIQRIAIEAEPPGKEESSSSSNSSLKDGDKFSDKSLTEAVEDERKLPEVTQEMLKDYFIPMGIPFDEGSTISYDSRNGKLIVKNTPENLRRLEALLREVDIPPPLVLVDSKVMEVSMNTMEELGFDWMLTYTNTETDHKISFSGLSSNSFYRSDASNYVVSGLKLIPNFGGDHQFDLSLSIRALDQKDRGEILATPRLLVASGYPGTLKVAEERYFPDDWSDAEVEIVNGTSYTYTAPTPEFGDATPVGTIFKVTPTVSSNNYTVQLSVDTDITRMTGWSNYDYSIIIGDLLNLPADRSSTNFQPKMKMPEFSKRHLKSTVKIYDGETVVIGGILEDIASRREDKIPVLGDIPLVGRLFTDTSSASEKVNLMVFVTARLMKGNGLPVREARKQGLFEFNDR